MVQPQKKEGRERYMSGRIDGTKGKVMLHIRLQQWQGLGARCGGQGLGGRRFGRGWVGRKVTQQGDVHSVMASMPSMPAGACTNNRAVSRHCTHPGTPQDGVLAGVVGVLLGGYLQHGRDGLVVCVN